VSSKTKNFEDLQVTSSEPIPLFIAAVFPELSFDEMPSFETVQTAINHLQFNRKQVVIRLFGFDGKPPRKPVEIAREVEVTPKRIYQIRRSAMLILSHPFYKLKKRI
jgi:hypothetical protein